MGIKSYFEMLRHSDEKTKHRSAMTISIVASVIIISFGFLFLKDYIFSSSKKVENKNEEQTVNAGVKSPISSFSKFFQDTGEQFSNLRSSVSGVFTATKEVKASTTNANVNIKINSTTSTSSTFIDPYSTTSSTSTNISSTTNSN